MAARSHGEFATLGGDGLRTPGFTTVLIVDDDPVVRTILTNYFASMQARQIVQAEDGHKALRALKDARSSFDLVITDLNMPSVDGVQFLSTLKDHGFQGGLVIASGEAPEVLETASALAQLHGLKLLGHIPKPLSKQKLDAVLLNSQGTSVGAPAEAPYIEEELLRRGIRDLRIVPHYQPKVDLGTGRIVGAEALLRYQDSQRGLISAQQILPVARQSGLMSELTAVTLLQVMMQQRAWQDNGLIADCSVNIDPGQLTALDFPDDLAEMAQEYGLSPGNVTIEVTNEGFYDNFNSLMEVLARLRMNGFLTSSDDFGTGVSNLDTLGQLPFTELKIGGTFVSNALTHGFADAAIRTAVRMADSLDLHLVAEGVETLDQLNHIAAFDISTVQGFYLGEPMSAEQYEAWYRSNDGYAPIASAEPWEAAQSDPFDLGAYRLAS